MAGTKRKYYNGSLPAERFFRNIGIAIPEGATVPPGYTVEDIRRDVLLDPLDGWIGWMGNIFSHRDFQSIKKAVHDYFDYEGELNDTGIVYTQECDKEMKIQRRLNDEEELIEFRTKTDADVWVEDNTYIRGNDSISIVLGPSGSGKTTFCANGSIFPRRGKEFRVYMHSKELGTEGHKARMARLGEILEREIRNVLDLSEEEPFDCLDMTLYAIIDEAGNDPYFANTSNLHALRKVVSKYATKPQLVLSGTGLDLLTSACGSSGEGINKIRMMPWSIDDFSKLAKNPEMVQLVKKHSLYGAMVTNARAASFLKKWLDITAKWGEPDENVPHVLRGVAYDYISGSGLEDLDDGSRRKVVRAVCKVLDACVYNKWNNEPNIPDFEKDRRLLSEYELSMAKSLIDVHVKKTGEDTELHDGHHYAVSVTPAITLVLATLLGNSASLFHQWAGFEAVVALNELFKLVREFELNKVPECKIVQLDKPYHAQKICKTLLVPVMDPFTVLVNGERASFADVIAHYRLIQAKHCKHSNGTAQLFIKDELMKMGLLKCSPFEKKVFARSLYQIWKTTTESASVPQQEQAMEHGGAKALGGRQHRSLYPASLLISEKIKKKPICWEFENQGTEENPVWSRTDGGDTSENMQNMKESEWVDTWVDSAKPITVVFVTNGQKFQVNQDVAGNTGSTVEADVLETEGILHDSTGKTPETEKISVPVSVKKVLKDELIAGVNVEIVFARA